MNTAKRISLISIIYAFCLITHGIGQEVDDMEETEEDVKLKESDKGMKVSFIYVC